MSSVSFIWFPFGDPAEAIPLVSCGHVVFFAFQPEFADHRVGQLAGVDPVEESVGTVDALLAAQVSVQHRSDTVTQFTHRIPPPSGQLTSSTPDPIINFMQDTHGSLVTYKTAP